MIEYRLDAQQQWRTLDTEEDVQAALLGEGEVGQEGTLVELRAREVAGNITAPVSVQIPTAQNDTQPSPPPGIPSQSRRIQRPIPRRTWRAPVPS